RAALPRRARRRSHARRGRRPPPRPARRRGDVRPVPPRAPRRARLPRPPRRVADPPRRGPRRRLRGVRRDDPRPALPRCALPLGRAARGAAAPRRAVRPERRRRAPRRPALLTMARALAPHRAAPWVAVGDAAIEALSAALPASTPPEPSHDVSA